VDDADHLLEAIRVLEKNLSSGKESVIIFDQQTRTMNQKSPGIFVACTGETVFVRVIGRGACRNSEFLRQYGLRKLREGCRRVQVDLRECDGMDSTFLGVFAGFGLLLGDARSLTLFYLAPETFKAFSSLGLEQIASVHACPVEGEHEPFPDPHAYELLPGSDLTKKEPLFDAVHQATLMLECHENLCRLTERNEEKFRDVKHFLREDIARHAPEH
jgi:anti-anti-sigma regulatory factor